MLGEDCLIVICFASVHRIMRYLVDREKVSFLVHDISD